MSRSVNRVGAIAVAFVSLAWGLAAGRGEPPLVVRGGKVFTVTHGVLENGMVLIRDGVIQEVGIGLPIPAGARVVGTAEDVVLPGFIDAGTNLGTVEWDSVEEDYDEASLIVSPHLRIIDAFNPESRFIRRAWDQGISCALVSPGRGNLLAGQSAFLHLGGGDIAEMSVKVPAAVHGTLGDVFKPRTKPTHAYPYTRMGAAALLRQTLIDAQDYQERLLEARKRKDAAKDNPKGRAKPDVQAALEALVPVITGETPLVMTANRRDDILTALRIAREFKIRLIISEGAEAWRDAKTLASLGIPVILRPKTADRLTLETAKARPENAAILQKAGVKIAFQSGSVQSLGDLLPLAHDAIRHGLDPAAALRALSLNAAEIFGIADRVGSLDKGKWADLVVFSGDPLGSVAEVKTVILKGRVAKASGSRERT